MDIGINKDNIVSFRKKEKKEKKERISFYQLVKSIKGLKGTLWRLLLLSFMIQVVALMSPYYMQIVIDEVVVTYDYELLNVLAVGFLFLIIFNIAMTVIRGYIVVYLGANINQQLSFSVFSHIMRIPLTYFSKRHIGDTVSRFGSLQQIKKMIAHNMVESVMDGVMSITTLVMIFIYNINMAFIVLSAMILYLSLRLAWYKPLRDATEKSIKIRAEENSNFIENIKSIQSIKLNTMERNRVDGWQRKLKKTIDYNIVIEKLNIKYGLAKNLLFGLENIFIIYVGAISILNSNDISVFTIGMMTSFMAYKSQLTQRFSSLIDKLIEFKMLSLHLERVSDITLTDEEHNINSGCNVKIFGKITLSNVSYSHDSNSSYIFNNVNLVINPGESIAIIGESGVGKTTLMKVMMGLYSPTKGSVLIDGVNVADISKINFRGQVSSVMQNDCILSGGIQSNVSSFCKDIVFESVTDACKKAEIHEQILNLPNGYDTKIGDEGRMLSSGQVQRVIIARALYRNPKIIFLDEATSNLDVKTEKIISRNISEMKMTKVIIAHRPEAIISCDRILEIANGSIVEVDKKNFISNLSISRS